MKIHVFGRKNSKAPTTNYDSISVASVGVPIMRTRERHLIFGILTRQDFLPDRTADVDLLFIFSSNANAVFRLERFTEVGEFTYLGKHFPCVNAN